ncbi:40655_t:CDS:2, partial [Gigaspora margarita]
MNTRSKYILDFYQIFKLPIFGNFNDNLLATTRTRLNMLCFLLSQAQGATDANNNFTINPIKKLFQIRELILQIDFTTCQLPNQTGVLANSRLPITTVFENISDPVNSPVLRNFNIVYDQIHTIEYNTTGFVQFNTGFYWFVTVNNLNEPLRHLKYMSDENKSTRYAVGSEFKPERDLRGLFRDLGEEIRDLKRKLVEDREERDNKRNKNNSDKPKPKLPIPPPEDNNRPNNNNKNNRPNDNNTPTSTTSNTPTTTIPSTSTT